MECAQPGLTACMRTRNSKASLGEKTQQDNYPRFLIGISSKNDAGDPRTHEHDHEEAAGNVLQCLGECISGTDR